MTASKTVAILVFLAHLDLQMIYFEGSPMAVCTLKIQFHGSAPHRLPLAADDVLVGHEVHAFARGGDDCHVGDRVERNALIP